MPDEGPVGHSIHAGTRTGENGLTIKVALTAGFCYGVKRAVEMAWKAVDDSKATGKKAATLGPIIHNPQEVDRLESEGVFAQETIEGLAPGDLIVIRAHGIPKNDRAEAKDRGLTVMDATCPYVRRPQMLAERAAKDGYLVVIVGDPNHPEIRGVKSFAGDRGMVVRSAAEVASLPDAPKVALLVQTTQKREVFDEVVAACRARYADVKDMDTICDDTTDRQADVRQLAAQVDAMVIVGGRLSANTAKLADISRHYTPKTYLIERPEEIDPVWFEGCKSVGIAAGASTPDYLVGEVLKVVGARRAA
jgi:(E)-4-hydroxy-3-methyl-but-2-enyl pyrophosphate reductase